MSKPENKEKPSEESSFDELFDAFAEHGGDDESDGISLRNVDKWFRQAKLTEEFTSLDTSVAFSAAGKGEKVLTKEEFKEMVEKLAKEKKKDAQEILQKLGAAGPPSTSGAVHSSVAAATRRRLTEAGTFSGGEKEKSKDSTEDDAKDEKKDDKTKKADTEEKDDDAKDEKDDKKGK